MKKHQLFRNKAYVILTVGDHLSIIGQVKDSTVRLEEASYGDIFNIPQEVLHLESSLLFKYGNGQLFLYECDDIFFEAVISSDKSLKECVFMDEEGHVKVRVQDIAPLLDDHYKIEFRKRRSRKG